MGSLQGRAKHVPTDEARMNPRVNLHSPKASDAESLASLARASRRLHRPWVYLPEQARDWGSYVSRCQTGEMIGYLLRDSATRELLGVINASQVVRGVLQSAYLGFYVHAAHARRGVMTAGLQAVLKDAFTVQRLHRLEANIQPGNGASLELVERLGFIREGFSPRYLKIGGRCKASGPDDPPRAFIFGDGPPRDLGRGSGFDLETPTPAPRTYKPPQAAPSHQP